MIKPAVIYLVANEPRPGLQKRFRLLTDAHWADEALKDGAEVWIAKTKWERVDP